MSFCWQELFHLGPGFPQQVNQNNHSGGLKKDRDNWNMAYKLKRTQHERADPECPDAPFKAIPDDQQKNKTSQRQTGYNHGQPKCRQGVCNGNMRRDEIRQHGDCIGNQ